MEILDKVEMLSRKSERYSIVAELRQMLLNCDEDSGECDVCLGIRYALARIEKE